MRCLPCSDTSFLRRLSTATSRWSLRVAVWSDRTNATNKKVCFYIAQYPVRWTAQSASHFLPSLTDLFIPTPFSASPGSVLARQQLRAKTKSLTFPPLSIARYSFIQLSQQGRQWRERKCPIFETVAKGDSNPGSSDCESDLIPLSYRAPLVVKSKKSGQLLRNNTSKPSDGTLFYS